MKSNQKLILLCLLLLSTAVSAQRLHRQVIASAGNSDVSNSFTIGEVIVSADNLVVTAGFQQPAFLSTEPLGIKDITSQLNVYPVPTRDVVTINGSAFQGSNTEISLYNLQGQIMKVNTALSGNEMKLDLGNIPTGNYYLTLLNEANNTIAKYKILKIK